MREGCGCLAPDSACPLLLRLRRRTEDDFLAAMVNLEQCDAPQLRAMLVELQQEIARLVTTANERDNKLVCANALLTRAQKLIANKLVSSTAPSQPPRRHLMSAAAPARCAHEGLSMRRARAPKPPAPQRGMHGRPAGALGPARLSGPRPAPESAPP